jgi:hypothetical protein
MNGRYTNISAMNAIPQHGLVYICDMIFFCDSQRKIDIFRWLKLLSESTHGDQSVMGHHHGRASEAHFRC